MKGLVHRGPGEKRGVVAGPRLARDTAVRGLMAWPVASVEGEASLTEAAEALAADEVGALLVTEGGRLAGIVSERDVVAHVAAGADLSHLMVADVMTNDLVSIAPDDTILVAARRMEEARVRHLPVLDGTQAVGIVSMRDVFSVLAAEAGDELS